MKKIIAVDLDGTLLNSYGKCSENAANYLKKMKDSGYIIVVATGRMLSSALSVTGGASFANYVICDNGSCIYEIDTEEFLYKSVISKKIVKELCLPYNSTFSVIRLCTAQNIYNIYNDENLLDDEINNIIDNSEDILHISINLKDCSTIYEIESDLIRKIPDLSFMVMQDSFENEKWFDVGNKNNSKYNSISKVATIENISNDNIICFGDGLNDIDMIKRCGVGVAMGNALKDVKDVSDFITNSNDEDGIFKFLKKMDTIM